MKKILLLLLISSKCLAQQKDSTSIRLDNLEHSIMRLSSDLKKSHQEYSKGIFFHLTGVAFTIGGIICRNQKQRDLSDVFFIGGGLCYGVGMSLIIDSHSIVGELN